MIKKERLSKYAGAITGGLYGLLMRFIFSLDSINGDVFGFDLFSVTFIWVVPVIIGIVPLIFANDKQLESIKYSILLPVISVLIFFGFALLTRIEDLLCLVIIMIPFMFGAMVGGFLFSKVVKYARNRKGIIYSVMLFPFFSAMIENKSAVKGNAYAAKSVIIINAPAEKIWENIIRVKEIRAGEYPTGFFNYAGIAKPLYAELDHDTLGAMRTGYFEGGLTFLEKVTKWERNREIAFDITVHQESIRKTIFDQHVLKGNHFKFVNAGYHLEKLTGGRIKLTLTSLYELRTNINSYSSFWGRWLLSDFQDRLLSVIKKRAELAQ